MRESTERNLILKVRLAFWSGAEVGVGFTVGVGVEVGVLARVGVGVEVGQTQLVEEGQSELRQKPW